MRYSKFINISENILVEYIYDDNNLIGEPYNILYNSTTNTSCFVSTDQLVPPIKGYQQTNNELYNQLFIVSQDSYARVPSIGSNQISEVFPNLLVRNYPTSIPIRYDKIRVHIPVDYTFDPNKGFFLRVYTLDSTQRKFVELSNYHFDISDIEQQYKLEYSSNTFIYAEKQWGKYLEIQVPSITKISDQITDGLPTPNSINANLTDGLGLSRNAPIFIDFKDLTSISTLNGVKFVSTSTKKTIVLPQTPEFENLGVRIEESSQGDFFIIYPTYNGTQAEFVDYLDEQLVFGVKYQVKYIIDLFEEDVKSKSYTFNIYEDFGGGMESYDGHISKTIYREASEETDNILSFDILDEMYEIGTSYYTYVAASKYMLSIVIYDYNDASQTLKDLFYVSEKTVENGATLHWLCQIPIKLLNPRIQYLVGFRG